MTVNIKLEDFLRDFYSRGPSGTVNVDEHLRRLSIEQLYTLLDMEVSGDRQSVNILHRIHARLSRLRGQTERENLSKFNKDWRV